MPVKSSPLKTKSLRRSENAPAYKLYRAALEWDLAEPIIIESRDDLRSAPQWRDRLNPYHHQVTNLMSFCRRLPVTLLADDVGLGKTISAGLVISELVSRGRISKILIVCPKLLMPQWREELDTKFGIPAVIAIGRDLHRLKLQEEATAIITTYQSARLYFKAISSAGFEMLILDEAHKLRNLYGTDTPPQVATRFRQALADRVFKYVLMLTATPIQNRLWDLYSLVDLLTVARGHENPFGSEGMFARKFIADEREKARQLRPDKRDEFRSIVNDYMSRVRRADAKLYFPSRVVQLHKVAPTEEELELIKIISAAIQGMNRLAQISILQALTSSPEALASQLETMARNRTAPIELAETVRSIVERIEITAKLDGLQTLVANLKTEKPRDWRMVVFTGRRETQVTIEAFLSKMGVKCGLINGDSGQRNQRTISDFKKDPPDIHAIISTEAGSEGVNLQAANIVINYDLPWNPMIVEQRIGRVQRLASQHSSVCVFNVILQGTFEEYIVGRLMEKLQMASHAIGDLESLLEAAGLDEAEGSRSFADMVRELVVASLVGKDVEKATRLAEESIKNAKVELEREEQNINSMLSGMDGAIDLGPKCPKLPPPIRSLEMEDFVIKALQSLGAKINPVNSGSFTIFLDGRNESIRFANSEDNANGTLCKPGSPFFERLVSRIAGVGQHFIEDLDRDASLQNKKISEEWVTTFGGSYLDSTPDQAWHCFNGNALLRIRATVAHDSYERLIDLPCSSEGQYSPTLEPLAPISKVLEDPNALRIPLDILQQKAMEDALISEFCQFYEERLANEIKSTGDDERKRKKLEDDLTPRVQIELAGLEGKIYRKISARISYKVDEVNYESRLTSIPLNANIVAEPEFAVCSITKIKVPVDCLGRCVISGAMALKHKLKRSEVSNRLALSEHMVVCAMSGKQVISDEIEKSVITGRSIAATLLKTSAISHKRAEPEYFGQCQFSSSDVLKEELATSQISGKNYRMDEELRSALSGKVGHKSEFIYCALTNQALLPNEAERCELTGKMVMPGSLGRCDVTGKRVLPSELEKSSVSGKSAIKKLMVSSSLSSSRLLETEAIKSAAGKYCSPQEAKLCHWGGNQYHPDDLQTCDLTGLTFYSEHLGRNNQNRLNALARLLDGSLRSADKAELWSDIEKISAVKFDTKDCKIDSAALSLDNQRLAVSLVVKKWFGLSTRQAGFVYSISDKEVMGRVLMGQRINGRWMTDDEVKSLTANKNIPPKKCSNCHEANNPSFAACWKCHKPF